jgi:hypothetical protein
MRVLRWDDGSHTRTLFANHKAGIKASSVVKRYGKRLYRVVAVVVTMPNIQRRFRRSGTALVTAGACLPSSSPLSSPVRRELQRRRLSTPGGPRQDRQFA